MARKKKHDEEHMSEAWLIPYADVLTLLLAVFIILFSTSQSDQKKFQEVAEVFGKVFKGSAYIVPGFTGQEIMALETAGSTGGPSSAVPPADTQDSGGNQTATEAARAAAMAAARAAAQEATAAEMRSLAGEIQDYISQQGMSADLEVKMTGSAEMVITIKEKALFHSGSADITEECRPLIRNIANILKAHPNIQVTVSGHTDNVPMHSSRFNSNFALSSARATTSMELLIHDSGLNPASFHSEGYGEYKPVATNDTPEGRSMNRRVEFSIKGNVSEESIIIPIEMD